MRTTRFTETQIVRALKEGEEGRKTDDIYRELEVSKATFYNWKSRYGGMEASDVKRLKELEEENARLKKMFAELSMNHDILKEVITKKVGAPATKTVNQEIVLEHGLSVTGACKLTGMCRSQYYYVSKKDDSAIIAALDQLSSKHPVYGFRKLYAYLRREGKQWNHKKVYRVYKRLNMSKKRRKKRRLPAREKQPLEQQISINQKWSKDFMSDSLASGNRFRTFNVMDDCPREILCIEIATSISSLRVTRTLEQIIDWRGKPICLRVDNGPEFTSHHFELWCKDQGIAIQFFQPGKPMQNGYIERFNRSYRKEILDAYLFFNLSEVRECTQAWMDEYNNNRPHEGLGNLTPTELSKNIRQQQQINQLVP